MKKQFLRNAGLLFLPTMLVVGLSACGDKNREAGTQSLHQEKANTPHHRGTFAAYFAYENTARFINIVEFVNNHAEDRGILLNLPGVDESDWDMRDFEIKKHPLLPTFYIYNPHAIEADAQGGKLWVRTYSKHVNQENRTSLSSDEALSVDAQMSVQKMVFSGDRKFAFIPTNIIPAKDGLTASGIAVHQLDEQGNFVEEANDESEDNEETRITRISPQSLDKIYSLATVSLEDRELLLVSHDHFITSYKLDKSSLLLSKVNELDMLKAYGSEKTDLKKQPSSLEKIKETLDHLRNKVPDGIVSQLIVRSGENPHAYGVIRKNNRILSIKISKSGSISVEKKTKSALSEEEVSSDETTAASTSLLLSKDGSHIYSLNSVSILHQEGTPFPVLKDGGSSISAYAIDHSSLNPSASTPLLQPDEVEFAMGSFNPSPETTTFIGAISGNRGLALIRLSSDNKPEVSTYILPKKRFSDSPIITFTIH